MGVPVVYRKETEQKIASYSFYDLTTGTGYKNFYGMDASLSGASIYLLSTESITADVGFVTGDNVAHDLDFDLNINLPTTIQGRAFIAVPLALQKTGAPAILNTLITMKIYLVRSGVETQLGPSVNRLVTTSTLADAYAQYHATGAVDLPITILEAGDKLRVNISNSGAGAGGYVKIFYDPTGLNKSSTPSITFTELNVLLPFKIDL